MKRSFKSLVGLFIPAFLKSKVLQFIQGKTFNEIEFIEEIYKNSFGAKFTMVDVGAHRGSALIPFAKKGWSIYAFEPDNDNRKLLESTTNEYSNIQIDTRAVSEESNTSVPFFKSELSTGISGLFSFHESHQQSGEVRTVRLDDFCKENKIDKIDFLKIDAEGYDLVVLKSFDWENQTNPDFIIAEYEDRKSKDLGYLLKDMISLLENKGYSVLISEWHPIQEYGSSHKWNKFTWNYQMLDSNLAWGNIIACKGDNIDKLKSVIAAT